MHRNVVGKPEGNRTLERLRNRFQDTIIIDLEVQDEAVDGIY